MILKTTWASARVVSADTVDYTTTSASGFYPRDKPDPYTFTGLSSGGQTEVVQPGFSKQTRLWERTPVTKGNHTGTAYSTNLPLDPVKGFYEFQYEKTDIPIAEKTPVDFQYVVEFDSSYNLEESYSITLDLSQIMTSVVLLGTQRYTPGPFTRRALFTGIGILTNALPVYHARVDFAMRLATPYVLNGTFSVSSYFSMSASIVKMAAPLSRPLPDHHEENEVVSSFSSDHEPVLIG